MLGDSFTHLHVHTEFSMLDGAAKLDELVAKAVAEKRAEIWVKENAQAFECWNAYIEKNGLPLEKYRSF